VNPFYATTDPDRHHIWHRLIEVDSEAFVRGDWSMIEDDFDAEHFEGVRCGNSTNPADWIIAFARLADYRDSWVAASREFVAKRFVDMTALEAVLRRTRLDRIDIAGDRAIAHKQFSGAIQLANGSALTGSRQTLYRLHRQRGIWKIVGFLGQLPLTEEQSW
jgi:hypothetical protein